MTDHPDRTSRRALQAAQTRADILEAARRLLADRGYAGTSVKDIAEQAGVSVQTVYDSVGSKPALVLALNDVLDAEADIATLARTAFTTGTPDAIAALPAQIARAIIDNAGDIARIVTTAARSDDAVRAALEDGRARHVAGTEAVALALVGREALRPGLDADEAAGILAVLSDTEVALVLHDSYGWSPDRIEAFILDVTRRLVLAEPEPG